MSQTFEQALADCKEMLANPEPGDDAEKIRARIESLQAIIDGKGIPFREFIEKL